MPECNRKPTSGGEVWAEVEGRPIYRDKVERLYRSRVPEARRQRVEIGDWFMSPIDPVRENQWMAVGYQRGSCPRAEEVSRRVVTVPFHPGVGGKDVVRTLFK